MVQAWEVQTTVQLMAKFKTLVVFSCVLFEALVKTRVPHVSEPIARVGLVHTSLRFSRLRTGVFHVSHYKVKFELTNRALIRLDT